MDYFLFKIYIDIMTYKAMFYFENMVDLTGSEDIDSVTFDHNYCYIKIINLGRVEFFEIPIDILFLPENDIIELIKLEKIII